MRKDSPMTEIRHPLPYGTIVRAGQSSVTKPGETGLHMIVKYEPGRSLGLPYWVISFDDYDIGLIAEDYFERDGDTGWEVVEMP